MRTSSCGHEELRYIDTGTYNLFDERIGPDKRYAVASDVHAVN